MEECDLELIVRARRRLGEDLCENGIGEGHAEGLPAQQEHREDDRTETVEQQVNDRGAAGVGICADGRKQRRDAGADVGADDDVIHAVARAADEHAARRKHDDDTRDRRRGLHDPRGDNADEKEQERVVDDGERVFDRVHDLGMQIGVHRAGHDRKSHENKAKPREDIADDFHAFALAEHRHEHADDGQNEQERRNIETAERGDPRRDGRADVRAHDDGGRLKERHDSGVDETDDHDGRGGRALNDDGGGSADADARNTVVRRLVEHRAEFSVRQAGHALRHHLHTDEECAETAQKLQHEIDYFHKSFPLA